MHTWLYSLPVIAFFALFGFMWWKGRLPSIDTIHQLAEIANTAGGSILLLWATSLLFFFATMRYLYWVLNKIVDGKIDASSAFALAGFTFITGNAFGGAFSSMLKTMTGSSTIGSVKTETSEKTTTVTAADSKQ